MFDWQTIVALGALAISCFVVFSRAVDKSLSKAEHEEFRKAVEQDGEARDQQIAEIKRHIEDRIVIREFKDWREQIHRDFNRIEADLRIVDQTKPSTGELQVAMKAIEDRIVLLEVLIRDAKNGDARKA